MSYDNVKLWFAKDENERIITIDEINDTNKNNTYLCPVCGSDIKPKALKSKQVTSHFAHVDSSKCNSETMIHWWFKNKFLEKGDIFTISTDATKEYICKNVLVEQSYAVGNAIYKPDVTILTECGQMIYFEMAFANKKQIKDYLDIWLQLKNIVVEVDIKQLIKKDKLPVFKTLYYEGKYFNTKNNDTYYNTIGKYKEENFIGCVTEELKERIRKLDWFWNDVFRYKNGEINIENLSLSIEAIDNKQDKRLLNNILNNVNCIKVFEDYITYKLDIKYSEIRDYILDKFGKEGLEYISKEVIYNRSLKKYIGYLGIFNASWKEISIWDVSDSDGERYFKLWVDNNIPKNLKLKEEINV